MERISVLAVFTGFGVHSWSPCNVAYHTKMQNVANYAKTEYNKKTPYQRVRIWEHFDTEF